MAFLKLFPGKKNHLSADGEGGLRRYPAVMLPNHASNPELQEHLGWDIFDKLLAKKVSRLDRSRAIGTKELTYEVSNYGRSMDPESIRCPKQADLRER